MSESKVVCPQITQIERSISVPPGVAWVDLCFPELLISEICDKFNLRIVNREIAINIRARFVAAVVLSFALSEAA